MRADFLRRAQAEEEAFPRNLLLRRPERIPRARVPQCSLFLFQESLSLAGGCVSHWHFFSAFFLRVTLVFPRSRRDEEDARRGKKGSGVKCLSCVPDVSCQFGAGQTAKTRTATTRKEEGRDTFLSRLLGRRLPEGSAEASVHESAEHEGELSGDLPLVGCACCWRGYGD